MGFCILPLSVWKILPVTACSITVQEEKKTKTAGDPEIKQIALHLKLFELGF